ncbi:MAG: asparagine synthase-related protein [Pseudomonadota bacterium]
MCGIAALWGQADHAVVETIIERQRHRGPDDQGHVVLVGRRGAFGHCRLAIIDPEGGHQPFQGPNDTVLVANGMIYNDRVIRAELARVPFQTGSDSEGILHLVMKHGASAVESLDGMFAFVIYQGGEILAARDPIGIKPLYWGRVGESLAFASEIKALAGLATEIEEFPPGHVFSTANGWRRYYDVPEPSSADLGVDDAIAKLQTTLEAAVVKRLRSDVPFGCFLSGGLDSSIIAALASRHIDRLETFAVGLEGSSDLLAAREVAAHLGTHHHELVIEPEAIIEALPIIGDRDRIFDNRSWQSKRRG